MSTEFAWDAPPLDAADLRLIEAYRTIGRPVDQLPYTEAFEELVDAAGLPHTNESRRRVFGRLLNLRKMGRLPRLGLLVDESTGLL